MKYFDTETEEIGYKKYCIYCGKEAIKVTEYDHRDSYDYYHCDCESAKKEYELENKIQILKNEFSSYLIKNTKSLNEIKYKYELNKLKNKYGQ